MGSGTTQAVAMKLGRRFLGADINLGAIQTTTKRLINLANELNQQVINDSIKYTGFEVYNVNNYDFFRNPVEARSLLIKALEIQEFPQNSSIWDGEKDGRKVKIMPVNRIASKADLIELIANLPYNKIVREGDVLTIRAFYPLNLMQKLSLQDDWINRKNIFSDAEYYDENGQLGLFDEAIKKQTQPIFTRMKKFSENYPMP